MSLAIHTKYIGPTNNRGARIKATCTIDKNTYADALSWAQQYLADWGRVIISGRFGRTMAERGQA